jgi:mRNA-degrading endonuclease toxin of MazEF toxin-antitoxin module
MVPGELYLAQFPYGGTPGRKLRPVLLLTGLVGTIPEVVVAYISTARPAVLQPSDLLLDPALPEHAATNPRMASVLRLHKLATIHESSVRRYLGTLSAATAATAAAKLRVLFGL